MTAASLFSTSNYDEIDDPPPPWKFFFGGSQKMVMVFITVFFLLFKNIFPKKHIVKLIFKSCILNEGVILISYSFFILAGCG